MEMRKWKRTAAKQNRLPIIVFITDLLEKILAADSSKKLYLEIVKMYTRTNVPFVEDANGQQEHMFV